MIAKINWLHLTDLHMGVKHNELWPNIEEEFFKDLEYLVKKEVGPIDIIFFTGDLVQSGKEFEQINILFRKLWEKFKQIDSQPQLLVVPGNHDLVRPDKLEDKPTVTCLTRLWDNEPAIQDDFWNFSDSPYRKVVDSAFQNYTKWWSEVEHKPKDISLGILPGDFAVTIEKNGIKLGVIGLNSAFLQLTGDKFFDVNVGGTLALDVRQFNQVCGGHGPDWINEHNISLLLTHHPPSWLAKKSQEHLNSEIHAPPERFALHLFGHMHENNLSSISSGGGNPRNRIQGCSLFSTDKWGENDNAIRHHGYIVGQFKVGASGQLRIWPRKAIRRQDGTWEIVSDSSFNYPRGRQEIKPIPIKIRPTMYGPGYRFDRLNVSDIAYRNFLREETDFIDVRGIGEAREILSFPMLKLYIKLHITEESIYGLTKDLNLSSSCRKIPIIDAVDKISYLLIEGDAGSGKTTFLRHLARSYVDIPTQPLPLLLNAPDLYNHWLSLPQQKRRLNWQVFINYWIEKSNDQKWGFTESWLTQLFEGKAGHDHRFGHSNRQISGHEMRNQLRLGKKIDDLQQQWELLNEKLSGLNEQSILETRVEEKLRLRKLIDDTKIQCDQVEEQLKNMESHLAKVDSDAKEVSGPNKEVTGRNDDQGRKALILMDKFDELPDHDARIIVTKIIDDTNKKWKDLHWVLGSRPGVAVRKAIPIRFKCIKIARLEDAEIDHFIRTWISLLFEKSRPFENLKTRTDAYAYELIKAIHNRKDIHFFASNPVMLTAMAVVHWNQRKLPEGRAKLCEAIIDWLFSARETPKSQYKRESYQVLALAMFQCSKGRQTEVDIGWAADKIMPIIKLKGQGEPLNFLEEEESKTGLIVHRREGRIAFWHLSFQEYLAACQIASLSDQEGWLLIKDHLEELEWREVLRFIPVRILTGLGKGRVSEFLRRILNTQRENTPQENARIVGILGEILHDLSAFDYSAEEVPAYLEARDQIMGIFTKEGFNISLSLQERYLAAIALGKAGDPRLMNPEDNWINISAGWCFIGAQKNNPQGINYDELALDDQQPTHKVFTKAFNISKYSVIVHDYTLFIEENGYLNKSFWCDDGWCWRNEENIIAPEKWNDQLLYPNRPIVGVSWYEAYAYCVWLSSKGKYWDYRLPTEAEWEYMARRNSDTKKYTRYCCGNIIPKETENKFNSEFSNLGCLAPIGLFPYDSSYDGVVDINGNIMEWMLNPGPYQYTDSQNLASFVYATSEIKYYYLRGGNWRGLPEITAHRSRLIPQNRGQTIGFRVLRIKKSIPLKGRFPVKDYFFTLADIYVKHQDEEYSPEDAQARLAGYAERFQGMGIDFIAKLFPKAIIEKKRVFERLPVVLGDAQPEKLEFNLHYQDTRIKLAVEDKLGSCRDLAEYQQDAQDLMEVVAILLNTVWDGQPLWRSLTDNDLDALIYMTLGSYDSTQEEKLLKAGYEANERALQGLMEWEKLNGHSLEKLISYQIFAGTVWWLDTGPNLDTQFTEMGTLEINDFERFQNEVLGKPCKLVFFFSDNGELVWDLLLIQFMLKFNRNLQVLGVINTIIIGNDANKQTLQKSLESSIFNKLKEFKKANRFSIFEEPIIRSSIDLSFCSDELLNQLKLPNIALIKGACAFETMQKLPINAYYAFVVNNQDSQDYTGLKRGSGILVRIPEDKEGYGYHRKTLKDIHPQLYSFENE